MLIEDLFPQSGLATGIGNKNYKMVRLTKFPGRKNIASHLLIQYISSTIYNSFIKKIIAMLNNLQMVARFGEPGNPDNFTVITVPYPMRIAWNPAQITSRMQCHKLAADAFLDVFNELLTVYGTDQ